MRWRISVWILPVVLIAGCGGSDEAVSDPKDPAAAAPKAPAAAPKAPLAPKAPAAVSTSDDPSNDAGVVRKVAEAGVTGRGDYRPGIITTPIATYFNIRERIKFIEVKSAMNMFQAMNERYPKSHEEFMEKIIEANGIRLPELLGINESYKYDPETATLMVEETRPGN